MNKSQFYLSQCVEAASKSPMAFTLGSVMVKGGKIISHGYNHHRTHYDGGDIRTRGHRKPVSMHAEMHAIFNVTGGMSPSFKKQVQGSERAAPQYARKRPPRAKGLQQAERCGPELCVSRPSGQNEGGTRRLSDISSMRVHH